MPVTVAQVATGGISPVLGGGSFPLTLTADVPRGSALIAAVCWGMSGGTRPPITFSDPKGNSWQTEAGTGLDLLGTRTSRTLGWHRANITKGLVAGQVVTGTFPGGYNGGMSIGAELIVVNKQLAKLAEGTVDQAFAAQANVTMTRQLADTAEELWLVGLALTGDADDAAGAGDAAWSGHFDHIHGNAVPLVAYRVGPGLPASDSWDFTLQQTRDFWSSGVAYRTFALGPRNGGDTKHVHRFRQFARAIRWRPSG